LSSDLPDAVSWRRRPVQCSMTQSRRLVQSMTHVRRSDAMTGHRRTWSVSEIFSCAQE